MLCFVDYQASCTALPQEGPTKFSFHLEYYRQTPPKVPHFLKTLVRRKLVLWFLASEVLRDYWLSGVCAFVLFLPDDLLMFTV